MIKYSKILSFFIALSFTLFTNAQTTTVIDYSTWSNTECNAFRPFPPTINSIVHTSTCGQPIFDNTNTNKWLRLNASTNGTNVYSGTEFKIDYNFKQGYNYTITVNAASNTPTFPVPNCRLRLEFSSASGGGGSFCNGVEILSSNIQQGINTSNQEVSTTSFSDKVYQFNSLQSARPSLYIASNLLYVNGTASSYVLIRKITITESLPPPTFTINPSTVSLSCGSTSPTTFTVNNVYNSPGTLGHSWDLGSANNGWLYLGNPAPQIINTSTNNSITLTPASIVTPNNVVVTVSLNNVAVQTLTSTVTSQSTPYLSPANYNISGPTDICNATTYTLNGANSGSSVIWSLNPSNVANVSGLNNQVTVTPILFNQSTNLRATLLNSSGCADGYTDFLVRTIEAIKLTPQNMVVCYDDYYNIEYPRPIDVIYCPSNGVVTWDVPSEFNNDYTIVGNRLTLNSGPTYEINPASPLWITANVFDPSTGLTYSTHTNFWTQSCYGYKQSITAISLSPNPTSGQVNVTLNSNDKNAVIKEIRVKNKMGVPILYQKFISGSKTQNIILNSQPTDVYIVEVFDGKNWHSQQLILKR